jgi:DNA-binding PadR family transcriptional regulator
MENDRPRKVYSLTNEGRNMLNFTENSLNLICQKMGANQNAVEIEASGFGKGKLMAATSFAP